MMLKKFENHNLDEKFCLITKYSNSFLNDYVNVWHSYCKENNMSKICEWRVRL